MTKIPYKINLSEDELPKYWQNIRPYMQEAPDPFINPVTFKPCTADDLRPVFCDELIEQELDNTNKFIEIPEEIRDFYKMYRPSPLTKATIVVTSIKAIGYIMNPALFFRERITQTPIAKSAIAATSWLVAPKTGQIICHAATLPVLTKIRAKATPTLIAVARYLFKLIPVNSCS